MLHSAELPSFWRILWIIILLKIRSLTEFTNCSCFLFRFFFGLGWTQNRRRSWVEGVCLFKPRVFRTYKLPPFLKTTSLEMLEKTLIILPSSTFLLLYTSCWTLGNPFTYHHSPHFPALPRRLYALMIEWISQLKTILSNGHNGLRGSSSFLMIQNLWKLLTLSHLNFLVNWISF